MRITTIGAVSMLLLAGCNFVMIFITTTDPILTFASACGSAALGLAAIGAFIIGE
jgi:hypothetical protein